MDPDAIETYVGRVIQKIEPPSGPPSAFKVEAHDQGFPRDPAVPLWGEPPSRARESAERLHPRHQVWVHVLYDAYRTAYMHDFAMPAFRDGYFLDHIQNRRAIEARGLSHPYLRLCPVSRGVNTSGGHLAGGEGMERGYLDALPGLPATQQAAASRAMSSKIIYADPMDLTKMLDIKPGTGILKGVRETQTLFLPA